MGHLWLVQLLLPIHFPFGFGNPLHWACHCKGGSITSPGLAHMAPSPGRDIGSVIIQRNAREISSSLIWSPTALPRFMPDPTASLFLLRSYGNCPGRGFENGMWRGRGTPNVPTVPRRPIFRAAGKGCDTAPFQDAET